MTSLEEGGVCFVQQKERSLRALVERMGRGIGSVPITPYPPARHENDTHSLPLTLLLLHPYLLALNFPTPPSS